MNERVRAGASTACLCIELPDDPGLHERLRIAGGRLDKLGGHRCRHLLCRTGRAGAGAGPRTAG
jgi:urease accessory protein